MNYCSDWQAIHGDHMSLLVCQQVQKEHAMQRVAGWLVCEGICISVPSWRLYEHSRYIRPRRVHTCTYRRALQCVVESSVSVQDLLSLYSAASSCVATRTTD